MWCAWHSRRCQSSVSALRAQGLQCVEPLQLARGALTKKGWCRRPLAGLKASLDCMHEMEDGTEALAILSCLAHANITAKQLRASGIANALPPLRQVHSLHWCQRRRRKLNTLVKPTRPKDACPELKCLTVHDQSSPPEEQH